MNTRLRIFLFCGFFYLGTALLAMLAAWRHATQVSLTSLVGPLEISLESGIIFAIVFIVFTVMMVRFVRVAQASLSILLAVALIAGSQFIFSAWLSSVWSILLSVGFVGMLQSSPRVITHNSVLMVGIGGIAGILGLSMTPLIACALLGFLSVYDIISVYRTKHMVVLAGRMLETGAVFGFLIPPTISGFMMSRREAITARSVMMIGSGDIGLPLILAASAVTQSIEVASVVILFSIGGFAAMQWLFARQTESAPMAALPPIALSAILGYFCAIVLGF